MEDSKVDILRKELKCYFADHEKIYKNSYEEFIQYFQNIPVIGKHDLIIAAHFIYGNMPTTLHLELKNEPELLKVLNKAKTTVVLDTEELEIVKKNINNSMIGTSKILYCINPDIYPILESKIFKCMTGTKSVYGMSKPANYLKYIADIHQLIEDKNFVKIQHSANEVTKCYLGAAYIASQLLFQEKQKKNSRDSK